MHRFSKNLPASHRTEAIETEGAVLLASIVADLQSALASLKAKGTYDFAVAARQLKRVVRTTRSPHARGRTVQHRAVRFRRAPPAPDARLALACRTPL